MSTEDFLGWTRRLVPQLPAVVRLYLPGSSLDARRRELVGAVVAAARHEVLLQQAHESWLDFLGPAELDDIDDEVFAWVARAACSLPGSSLPDLPVDLDEDLRRALSACVAHGVVTALTLRGAESALSRVTGRRRRSLPGLASDLVVAAAGAPLVVPLAAAAGTVVALGRLLPDLADVEVEPEPNLLAQLLADALPAWLGGVWGRLFVALVPVEVPVSWRSGQSGATVRLGRGRVLVSNGLADDAWALFDGDVDSLVRAGSLTLAREVRAAHAEH